MSDSAYYEAMSPTLLAKQPVNGARPERDSRAEWNATYSHLESRLGFLKAWRYSWWSHWARLAEYFLPRRYHWLVVANRMWRGSPINDAIIDSTGTLAMRTCAAGMWTGLTSPSRPWFQLEVGLPWIELDAAGKSWLEDTQQKVYTVLAQSNFYQVMGQAFQDVTVFGTAPVIIYEDYEDVIRCYLPCAGEYYLAAGSRLSVDTLYREFTLTVAQIVEMFGIDNCPPEVAEMWRTGGASMDSELVVAHAIEPNMGIAKRGPATGEYRMVPAIFTFREVYWLRSIKTAQPLSVRGFRGAPFMAARWATVSNDAYGRAPCMDALGDTKQIQMETRRKAEFIEKLVRPPMGADPELKNEPASIIPGHITYMSSDGGAKKGFWPLFEVQPAALGPLVTDIASVSARIERCLFVDLFMAISRMEGVQPRNELELTKRDLERLQELGPFVQMFENEFAGPAIRRVLDVLLHRTGKDKNGRTVGMLKPLPPSLRGVPLKLNYVSIMKLAQRASEAVAMKDVFTTGGVLSSAAKAAGLPDPLRIIDLDKAMRHYSQISNFPTDCLFTIQEVETKDHIRNAADQQAQAPGAAMAAVTAAKTMADTPMGGNSALNAIMGGAGGSGGGPPPV